MKNTSISYTSRIHLSCIVFLIKHTIYNIILNVFQWTRVYLYRADCEIAHVAISINQKNVQLLTQKQTLRCMKITDGLSYFEYMHFDQIRLMNFDSQGKKFKLLSRKNYFYYYYKKTIKDNVWGLAPSC